MTLAEIKSLMNNFIKTLNTATAAYDQGEELLSDEEWDNLYFRLSRLEKDTGIILPNSPTHKISYSFDNTTIVAKVKHNHPMLSLDKTKSIEDILTFSKDKDIIAMSKMDGLTCSLCYHSGVLLRAETRGNGVEGELITSNAEVVQGVPIVIDNKDEDLIIDGEIICTYEDFEPFKDQYKNPRNFAAGSIKLLDRNEVRKRHLTFVAWDLINKRIDKKIADTLSEKLIYLKKLGFLIVPFGIFSEKKEKNIENYIKVLKSLSEKKFYPIDGIVFKYDSVEEYQNAGQTAHHFCGGLAYKFYDETYSSTLQKIDWTMSRNGTLTPVAVFDPVEIDGTTVTRASLHNLDILKETLTKPYLNQVVYVSKRNQIIPYIESAEYKEDSSNVYFDYPTICPCCGEQSVALDAEEKNLICTNSNCTGKLVNIIDHYCSKNCMNIKGLSKQTIEKLYNYGWLNSISDIYTLNSHKDEWIKKEGFGEKSVNNILQAIENSKECYLEDFIAAIGIPLIGKTVAKDLCKKVTSYEMLQSLIEEHYHFYELPNFGAEMHRAIITFDYSEADKIYKFLKIKVKEKEPEKVLSSLYNTTFCITGSLKKYKNRQELKTVIENNGGKVVNVVSSKVNYLINNDYESSTAKNVRAKELGIPIINEEDFENLLTL